MDLRSQQEILDKTYHPIQTDASFPDRKHVALGAYVELGKHSSQLRSRYFKMALDVHSKLSN
jgi:hypothetical protein